MDDDELQMLQREFMCVQQQKTNPLSERTVAEIMVKLYHQGFKFHPTTDGNQYITPQKLDKQILNLIIQRGHINVGLLPQILNVGLDTIQGRVIKLLTVHSSQSTAVQANIIESRIKIFRHNNLVLSSKYLASIIESIKQLLVMQGKVNLQTIAMQNQFNIKFTQKLINQNITQLNAQLINNQLITKQYNLMRKLKLLGFMRSISSPISFDQLLRCSSLGQQSQSNLTLQRLLQQIINQQKVKGKYQNSYYIPDSFLLNQKQRIIQFFNNNGYIEFQMLKKQFLVNKPQQWLHKNLTQFKDFLIFQDLCISKDKLTTYAHQIQELLKTEGFLELANVLPFTLQKEEMEKFLKQNCQLGSYFLQEGYCYSQKWIEKVLEQFKQKIFKNIFLANIVAKSHQAKNSKKNKGGKKQQKSKLIEEDQLIEKLYNQGLAEYSVAQSIAPFLLPILIKKLEQQKKKIQKQLGQNRGIINNTFLKYKSCSTIMKNIDGLQRNLNIIQKQKKKNNQEWIDKQFGPNQNDEKGLYSLIYYDGVVPKGWPALDQLRWQSFGLKPIPQVQQNVWTSSLVCQLICSIQLFNKTSKNPLNNPLSLLKQNQNNKQSPYTFGFYRNQNDRRYVIVDNKLPIINTKLISHSGIYGLAEKAYAKFRYCYKGIINLGVKTLLLQLTGLQPRQYTFEKNNHKDIIHILQQAFIAHKFIILIAEGQNGKKIVIQTKQGEQNIQICCMKPYIIVNKQKINNEEKFILINALNNQTNNNSGQKLILQQFSQVFKNIYVI